MNGFVFRAEYVKRSGCCPIKVGTYSSKGQRNSWNCGVFSAANLLKHHLSCKCSIWHNVFLAYVDIWPLRASGFFFAPFCTTCCRQKASLKSVLWCPRDVVCVCMCVLGGGGMHTFHICITPPSKFRLAALLHWVNESKRWILSYYSKQTWTNCPPGLNAELCHDPDTHLHARTHLSFFIPGSLAPPSDHCSNKEGMNLEF